MVHYRIVAYRGRNQVNQLGVYYSVDQRKHFLRIPYWKSLETFPDYERAYDFLMIERKAMYTQIGTMLEFTLGDT